MAIHNNHTGTLVGTISGTVLSIFATIQSEDIAKTVVLAAVGAIASFVVSLGLKWIFKRKSSNQ
jgi:hypothetical protein